MNELVNIYRKDKTRTFALKKGLPKDMSLETAKLYIRILDNVDASVERLEGDNYISERDPDFDELKDIYRMLVDIKLMIEARFK